MDKTNDIRGGIADYLFEDTTDHTDGLRNKPLQRISLTDGVDLPLNYPFDSSQPDEVARLQINIETVFDLMGIDFAAVTVSTTNDGAYDRWRIEITGTRLALASAWVTSGGALAGRDFIKTNCL